MIVSAEKNKLENLFDKIITLETFTNGEDQTLIEVYGEYSKILTKLYMKELNIFGNLKNHSFKITKEHRRALNKDHSPEAKQEVLRQLKDSLQQNIETSIDYITNYVYQ